MWLILFLLSLILLFFYPSPNKPYKNTMSTSTAENDSYLVENWDTETLIDFLKEQNLKLDDDHFKILRKKKINGKSFLLMNEKKLELCGLEIGPALLLAEVIRSLKDNKKRLSSSSCNLKVKEVLTKYNINDNGDDKELQQCVRETKLNTSEQETNNLTSTVSLSSTSTQTMNLSDPKSLTYLIQGLISFGLRHFCLDESLIFIGGKTEGVCRISSVVPRLSSVSLYYFKTSTDLI
ncbi:hypothetical protein C1645_393631 [Glomus cerebriforme]|uniref:SAM domain-containing protein n=1 Tax=Glomus cerebriforme TaxID=658196 RepID=A0A397SK16_9GLOM|nr:hypothetical protein C1645_393631 [Glomus cerebriforme]